MINITVREKKGYIVEYELIGHANFNTKGKDIVCAGVSALLLALLNEIGRYSNINHIVKDGYLKLEILNTSEKTKILTEMILTALEGIQLEYHDYVKVVVKQQES